MTPLYPYRVWKVIPKQPLMFQLVEFSKQSSQASEIGLGCELRLKSATPQQGAPLGRSQPTHEYGDVEGHSDFAIRRSLYLF